ncbi:MAG: dipicolinate synthase subunit B [Clostridia bacterium]|nr:dipicolinate synthase subunit B [Clostridia bacterium]
MKLAFAICGSFCTHKSSLEVLRLLSQSHDITAALSEAARDTDTRFGRADTLRQTVTSLSGLAPILSIRDAEEQITRGGFDALIISSCTGNTLAKLAHGITDSTVTMCAKAQLRNRRPVVIALATNDGLGANLANIALTMNKKNIYFVPFGQDDPMNKQTSLICDFSLVEQTLEHAIRGHQLQPVLL